MNQLEHLRKIILKIDFLVRVAYLDYLFQIPKKLLVHMELNLLKLVKLKKLTLKLMKYWHLMVL